MTSHLSISYAASPAAGAPAAAPAASAQAQSPLGLLGAIFDQFLAGATADASTPPTADATAPIPLGVPIPLAAPQPAPPGLVLLDTLADQLGDLQDELDSGGEPDSDKLQALSDTIDTLTILLAAPAPAAAPSGEDAPADTDSTAAPTGAAAPQGIAALIATPLPPAPLPPAPSTPQQLADLAATLAATLGVTPPVVQTALALPDDQAVALLQSVGLSADAPDIPALPAGTSQPQPGTIALPSAPAPTATSGDAVTVLSQKLADLGVALTAADPVIARKLETLSTAVSATRDGPNPLVRLDPQAATTTSALGPTTTAGTTLDSIVARLAMPRPSPPQTAVPVANASPLPETTTPAPIASHPDGGDPIATTTASPGPTTDAVPVEKVLKLAALTLTPTPAKPDSATKTEQRLAPLDPTDAPNRVDPPAAPQIAPASTASQPTHAARILPAGYQAAGHPINMGQVAFEMVRQAHQGLSRFAIRLDPPELGRVDVRMNVDPSGAVTAKLTVDRPETLDMFQRDQRTLERALQQAGLDSTRTTLEFSLRQNNSSPFANMSGGDQRHSSPSTPYSRVASVDDDDAVPLASVTTLYRGAASAGGVNLFV